MLSIGFPILLAALCLLWMAERSYKKEKIKLIEKSKEPSIYEKQGITIL